MEETVTLTPEARIRKASAQMHWGAGIIPWGSGPGATGVTLETVARYLELLRDRLRDAAAQRAQTDRELMQLKSDRSATRRYLGLPDGD